MRSSIQSNTRQLILFFFLAFAISWTIWGVGMLFPDDQGFAFFPIGVWGPAIAGMIMASRQKTVKQMLATIKPHRVSSRSLLVMLTIPILTMALPLLYFPLMGEAIPLSFIFDMFPDTFHPWWIIPMMPVLFPVLMIGNLGEEIGWRGYATRELGVHIGYLKGAILLGVLNALWHVPLYFLIGNPIYNPISLMFAGFILYEVGYTFLMMAMWLKVKQTIYVGLIVHTAVTVGSLFLPTWAYTSTILGSGVLMLLAGIIIYQQIAIAASTLDLSNEEGAIAS